MGDRERGEQADGDRHQQRDIDDVQDMFPGQPDGGVGIGDGRYRARAVVTRR